MSSQKILLLFLIALSGIGCDQQSRNSEQNDNPRYEAVYDTSKIAVIPFDTAMRSVFDYSYKKTSLTHQDFVEIDSLLNVCVIDYNNSLPEEGKIDLTKRSYKKQLIAVKNANGEKEVWINCFCYSRDNRWKTLIKGVKDGGNCYFNFKVNLTLKKYYNLEVNGGP